MLLLNSNSLKLRKEFKKSNSSAGKKQRIAVMFILVIGIFLTVFNLLQILLSSATVKKSTNAEYEQSVEQISLSNAKAFSNEIYGYIQEMRMYTETNTAQSGDIDAMRKWIIERRDIRNSNFDYVIVCGPNGVFYTDQGKTGTIKDRS